MKRLIILAFLQFFLIIFSSSAAITEWISEKDEVVKLRALASYYQDFTNNEIDRNKIIVAVEFKIKDGWKIYSHGSNGVGIEPEMRFDATADYKKHEILWPKAKIEEEKIGDFVMGYSTYSKYVVLPVNVELNQDISGKNLTFKLAYGICKEICIPANQEFTLNISHEPDLEALDIIQDFYPKMIIKRTDFNKKIYSKTTNKEKALTYMLLIAFIGGAILNIMPCVLPVLSIKLLSIIKHSGTTINKIRISFLATIAGILSCFVIFAAFAILIKLTGNTLGWGLQFQNPYFLTFLIVILIFFTANLLEIYHINIGGLLTNFLNKKIDDNNGNKKVFINNYLSGILAVLLATPCSAPFLGSAISFALVHNSQTIILMFGAIGLGFALPYLILLITPKLVYLLPKPGEWMNTTKQLMSGFLVATIIWLIYILIGIIGTLPALSISLLAIALIPCLKLKSILFKLILLISIFTTIFTLPFSIQKEEKEMQIIYDKTWQYFEEEKIKQYVKESNVVVVDVTADWCITCKFNKYRVFQNKEVLEILNSSDVIALQADITKPRPEIMKFLEKHGRYAIPFNIVFGPQVPEGILLKELLTKEELLDAIQLAKTGKIDKK